jgi:hypothetical protein
MVDDDPKKRGMMVKGGMKGRKKREMMVKGGLKGRVKEWVMVKGGMKGGKKRGMMVKGGMKGGMKEGMKEGMRGGVPPNVAQTKVVDTAGAVPSPAAKWEKVPHRRTAAHPNPGPPHRGTPYAYNRPNPHNRPQHERSNPHRRSAPGSATGYPLSPQSCPAASFSTDG